MVRWILGAIVAVLVSYYTAELSTQQRLTTVEVKQASQFDEMQRSLARIEADLREVKRTLAQ